MQWFIIIACAVGISCPLKDHNGGTYRHYRGYETEELCMTVARLGIELAGGRQEDFVVRCEPRIITSEPESTP